MVHTADSYCFIMLKTENEDLMIVFPMILYCRMRHNGIMQQKAISHLYLSTSHTGGRKGNSERVNNLVLLCSDELLHQLTDPTESE